MSFIIRGSEILPVTIPVSFCIRANTGKLNLKENTTAEIIEEYEKAVF